MSEHGTSMDANASQGEGFDRWTVAQSRLFTWLDLVTVGLIVVFGALQFGLYLRADDFLNEQVAYVEEAQSLLHQGFYGLNGRPETVMPPGFPAILAVICATVGCSPATLIRSMVIFLTLGFLVSYALLRYESGSTAAAASCLLLISSPMIFESVTRSIWPNIPYFFTSMLTLLVGTRLETAPTTRARTLLALLFGQLLAMSLMIQSAGIALLTGLLGWLAVSIFRSRQVAIQRCKIFVPLLILGIVVQTFWMMQARGPTSTAGMNSTEWPLGGYPSSYISQLTLKSANNLELGTASLSDILTRIGHNLLIRADDLGEMLTHHWVSPAWSSLAITGLLLLILLGVGVSFWQTGGRLVDWYFVCNEAMYLLWPWGHSVRFFLPVAPLACLYLWRGGATLLRFAIARPRAFGAWCLPISVLFGIYSDFDGWGPWSAGGLQAKFSPVFWMVLTVVSAWMVWRRSDYLLLTSSLRRWYVETILSVRGSFVNLPGLLKIAALAGLVGTGAILQLGIGRDNLNFDSTKNPLQPYIAAAQWLQSRTDETAVVMARHVPTVYHYAKRRVVWFAPISNPQTLMEGIRKHDVDYIIVVKGDDSYVPQESDCFNLLVRAYPEVFLPVYGGSRFIISKVVHSNIPEFQSSADNRDRHS